jgi:cytochrome P450
MRRDPLEFITRITQQQGDILRFRFLFTPALLINHPDYIRHVLQDNHRNYDKHSFDYEVLKPVVGNGLLTSDGDFWLRQRRLIQPAFHRQRIAALGEQMVQATETMLAGWEAFERRGEPVDAAAEMMRLTLTIVGRALFGQDLSSAAARVGPAFSVVNAGVAALFRSFIPTTLKFRLPPMKGAIAELDEVVNGIIAERRAAIQAGESPGDDLLGMLLQARDEDGQTGMTDKQLRDEVVTLLLAGHETTANLLAWTWYLLSKNPAAAEHLRLELRRELAGCPPSIDDLPRLKYTRMVLQETLRLYPPAWIISRRAIQDDVVGGHPIPAGTVISISPYAMHHHPGFWANPEGFDPQRFSPEQVEGRPQYAYFPFGGGPRLCIGRDFALQEAIIILATVAQRYRLDLVPGHAVVPEPLITLRPREGVKVRLRRI